ncbi:riboflavin synthase domain-like protein [Rhizopus microsporus var. microsporus]|uniref:NADPH-dependent diflavin oxidoreductase 1 n=1 Tax=Rhizopus microsporus var. microsporus TaxID=86635 RepID=A0A1X0QXX3_RHIZD|nr:riboflavin synthase domain-like protein [Rhizopus microsporus var. microsporus]
MENESRSIVILYGSETGSSQDLAENLARQAKRRHFKTRVYAMDDYDRSFWRFLLRKNLPNDILSDIDCAVVGLGDSSYRNFNYPSKKLYKRLLQLGANMLLERCDCDDQHYLGIDGAFIPWTVQFWSIVMDKYPTSKPILSEDLLSSDATIPVRQQQQQQQGIDMKVIQNTRITAPDHFQDVRHIELASDQLAYQPGDIAVIMPQNLREEVDMFLGLMGWSEYADQMIRITPNEEAVLSWPEQLKFRDLFIHHLDIFGVPRRSFFEMLAYFTKDENLKERLREFSSPEGQEDMWNYSLRPRRTITEVLFDFQPLEIPLDYILDVFPQLKPRSFSIASSVRMHPGRMELCVAIVKYKTNLKRIRRGVMTKWLATLAPGDIIPGVVIMKGTMSLPPADTPLIAIGPGTGVAPMRSFIEERVAIGTKQNVLFFGCRYHDKDFYYQDQWNTYQDKGQLVLYTAFSRDQRGKVYVQDRILEQSSFLWDLINQQGAKVVISGSTGKMPDQVAYAFKQIFMKEGGLSAQESEAYFSLLVKRGQYQEECWS